MAGEGNLWGHTHDDQGSGWYWAVADSIHPQVDLQPRVIDLHY